MFGSISIELQLIAEGKYPAESLDDLIGPMPKRDDLFAGYAFILTCTIPIKGAQGAEVSNDSIFCYHTAIMTIPITITCIGKWSTIRLNAISERSFAFSN